MDIRKKTTGSIPELIDRLKPDKEFNAIDQFLELALSTESDEEAKNKIKALIAQGYDINFSSLRNISNTTIYFFAPATLFLPLYINRNNLLKSINRLIKNGGSVNYLAMGFAISGQVDMAEYLRTQYQADTILIYMGYVTHDLYTKANLNLDHLTKDKSLVAKADVIKNLINYYEKKLLNDEKSRSIKKRVKLKMGDWESDFSIPENIDFNNQSLDNLGKIIDSIQYDLDYLIKYFGSSPANAFKEKIVYTLKKLHKEIQSNLHDSQLDQLNKLSQQLESAINKYETHLIPISQLFLRPQNLESLLDQYQKKLHSLTIPERQNFLYNICEELIQFNKTHLLDYFYQEYQFYIKDYKDDDAQNRNLSSLISIAISGGNLAFAKQIATDYPKALNENYSTRLRFMKNAGQGNLAADKTHAWSYYQTWCQYLPTHWIFTEDEIGCYLRGAFNAYPEIRLSLQHFEKLKAKPMLTELPENYYQIYIRQLFQLNSFSPREQKPDSMLHQALLFKSPAILMMLSQMPIAFLIEAEAHFRKIYYQAKIDFPSKESLLIKAIYINKMMGLIDFQLEEAHHLKSFIDDLKSHSNAKVKSDEEKPDHAVPISSNSKSKIFYPWESIIYFLSCNKALNQSKGKSEILISKVAPEIPIDIFFNILSYLFPIPKPDYPLINSERILQKMVYSQNRHLLFSPNLIAPEMKIIHDRVFKNN